MFVSGAAISLALLASSAQAVPTARSANLTCHGTYIDAPYMALEPSVYGNGTPPGSMPGFNSTYKLSDALAAVGSTASAGANPPVVINSGPFQGDGFKFLQCASSFMNYPSNISDSNGISTFYGHIEPTNGDGSQCVTRTKVSDGHEFFTMSPCRYDDTAAQEAQYFKLLKFVYLPDAQEVTWNLTLVGHPKGASGDSFSFTPGSDSAPAITVARNTPSKYQLALEYVHIN